MDCDHSLIEMDVTFGQPAFRYTRDLLRVNWEAFKAAVDNEIPVNTISKNLTHIELKQASEALEHAVHTALDKFALLIKKYIKERFKWWTEELDLIWKRR